MSNAVNKLRIIDARSPKYVNDSNYWALWREVYNGGDEYLYRYLTKFSDRETDADFKLRRQNTPVPAFAKAAVNDVRNSIFQRLRDVIRRGGSRAYMRAAAGEEGGVDRRGSTMQSFIGVEVLTDALVMGKCGIYIDAPKLDGPSLADNKNIRPYVYRYNIEDVLSWTACRPDQPGDFSAILLRDYDTKYDTSLGYGVRLPTGIYTRYRLVWINQETGKVNMRFLNSDNKSIDTNGDLTTSDAIELDLTQIPFVMVDVGGSLLKDISGHQKALLNLGSSDVAYALKANYPFFVEQKDMRNVGDHLRHHVADDGSTTPTRNENPGVGVRTGVTHGRSYDLKSERPAFIHPSPEPLIASIRLQEKLEDDIRKLINLAIQNKIGQRATSAEALKLSDQGLEAGLSYIGLVLEGVEKQIAQHWAAYEHRDPSRRQIAIIKYPDRYSLKTDTDRIKEAKDLSELMFTVPGRAIKKELSKGIVSALLSGRTNVEELDKIYQEIDKSEYATSDPQVIIQAQEAGLVGEQVASTALGFADDEYLQAREDHAARAMRVLAAQSKAKEADSAGARGVEDLAIEGDEGVKERDAATNTTLSDEAKKPQRGAGKSLNKGE